MKRTEEMTNLRRNNLQQSYGEIIAEIKNDNYPLLTELLNDTQFFLHILNQEDANVLSAFFKAAKENEVNIQTMIESKYCIAFIYAAQNTNHKVMELLLHEAHNAKLNIEKALKQEGYLILIHAVQNKNHEVMKSLLEYNDKHNLQIDLKEALLKSDDSVLLRAVINPDHNMLQLLLKHFKHAQAILQEEL